MGMVSARSGRGVWDAGGAYCGVLSCGCEKYDSPVREKMMASSDLFC